MAKKKSTNCQNCGVELELAIVGNKCSNCGARFMKEVQDDKKA